MSARERSEQHGAGSVVSARGRKAGDPGDDRRAARRDDERAGRAEQKRPADAGSRARASPAAALSCPCELQPPRRSVTRPAAASAIAERQVEKRAMRTKARRARPQRRRGRRMPRRAMRRTPRPRIRAGATHSGSPRARHPRCSAGPDARHRSGGEHERVRERRTRCNGVQPALTASITARPEVLGRRRTRSSSRCSSCRTRCRWCRR